MDERMAGQVALVTGGAGLIGSAISRRFAAEGATVIINGRDAAKADALATELRAGGAQIDVRIANVRDENEVGEMVEGIIERYGRLDVVVNNAGGVGNTGGGRAAYTREMSLDNWSSVLDLNLTAAFLCTRAALPSMVDRGYGRFINITSAGYFGLIGLSSYAAAKSGLIAFTKSVALEYAADGITANVVAPHLVESERGRTRPPEVTQTLLAQVPIKRFGRPEEVAGAVFYFASPDAGYVTGEVLHVMGGMEWVGPGIDMAAGLRPRQR